MTESAQVNPQKILISQVGSLLGLKLAALFLNKNKEVFGTGKITPPENILKNPNFMLLDINLSQPLPEHLPKFDLIIHLLHESTQTLKNYSLTTSLTPETNNVVAQAARGISNVILLAPLVTNESFYDSIAKSENTRNNLRLFLVGDIYGPQDPIVKTAANHPHTKLHRLEHFYYHNELTNLIAQAITSDKVILENEGANIVTPTFVDDATDALEKYLDANSPRNRLIVSEGPKTALTAAYAIQKVARFTLNKELKLFFAGPAKQITFEPHPVIHLQSLNFEPKVSLEEGLKKTFEYFKDDKKIAPSKQEPSRVHIQLKPLTKIPKSAYGANIKRIVIALFVIILIVLAKTGLDIYWGISSLKTAGNLLASGDFKNAKQKADLATKSLGSAKGKVKTLTWPLSFILPRYVNALNYSVASAQSGAAATSYFVEGAQVLVRNLKYITGKESDKTFQDAENISINFQQAYLESSKAFYLANISQNGGIFGNQLQSTQEAFKQLSNYSQSSLELVNLIQEVTSSQDKKTYLVLLQNNAELRPGGGFIGGFGEITFEKGKLKGISMEDVYTIDGQLRQTLSAPPELRERLGVEKLFLRDSNWSLDFALNSATARDFYKKETGKEVDGIIDLDLTFVQNILEKVGPVKLNDYNEQITAENLFEHGQYYKGFFSTLTKALVDQLIESLSQDPETASTVPWLDLVKTISQSLKSKHLLLSFDSPNISALIKTKGWANPLPPLFFDVADDRQGTHDFLAISEANLGANWVNRFIERKVDYEMTLGPDAALVAKLKITYKNTAQVNTWPAGTYVNFLRVYTPFSTSLFGFSNGQSKNLKDVEVGKESGLTVFSTFVEVPIKQTKIVEFTYRIPKNIQLEKAPTYDLYISKQPGTEKDPFTFTLNLPGQMQIESINGSEEDRGKQNYNIETDLSVDKQFIIEVAKK